MVRLLRALREAGAASQVTALASRAAADASLDDPDAVVHLLDALREAGAAGQVTALASRAAADASLDDPFAVVRLLHALQKVEAGAYTAPLLERLPGAGMFQLFQEQEGRGETFRFGREADGRPAAHWTWTDLG